VFHALHFRKGTKACEREREREREGERERERDIIFNDVRQRLTFIDKLKYLFIFNTK